MELTMYAVTCPVCGGKQTVLPDELRLIVIPGSDLVPVLRFRCPSCLSWCLRSATPEQWALLSNEPRCLRVVALPVYEDVSWAPLTEDEVLATLQEMHEELETGE